MRKKYLHGTHTGNSIYHAFYVIQIGKVNVHDNMPVHFIDENDRKRIAQFTQEDSPML